GRAHAAKERRVVCRTDVEGVATRPGAVAAVEHAVAVRVVLVVRMIDAVADRVPGRRRLEIPKAVVVERPRVETLITVASAVRRDIERAACTRRRAIVR